MLNLSPDFSYRDDEPLSPKAPSGLVQERVHHRCFVSAKIGSFMIFLKQWFAFTRAMFGGVLE